MLDLEFDEEELIHLPDDELAAFREQLEHVLMFVSIETDRRAGKEPAPHTEPEEWELGPDK